MKEGWKRVKISDVAIIQSGSGFPEIYQGQTGQEIPFYKVSDMNLVGNEKEMIVANNTISESVRVQLRASVFPENSIIFPKIGGAIATNKKRLTTRNCCVDNNVMGAIPIANKIESDLLLYFFEAHDLSDFANDAHLPSIKKTTVEDWEIVIPEKIIEQQRIVAILDEAFDGIATAKANAEKNLKNARELFESHLQSVFTQSGRGWSYTTIGALCEKVEYGSSAKSNDVGKIPVLRMGNIQNRRLDWNDLVYTNDDEEIEKYLLKHNDVLFNRTNSPALVGKTAIYKGEQPAIFAGYLIRIHRRENLLDADYLNYYLNSKIALDYGKTVTISSVNQANINGSKLKEYPISVPSLKEQKSLVMKMDALDVEVRKLEIIYQQKIQALNELKKSLLHKAFSGQL